MLSKQKRDRKEELDGDIYILKVVLSKSSDIDTNFAIIRLIDKLKEARKAL